MISDGCDWKLDSPAEREGGGGCAQRDRLWPRLRLWLCVCPFAMDGAERSASAYGAPVDIFRMLGRSRIGDSGERRTAQGEARGARNRGGDAQIGAGAVDKAPSIAR